MKVQTQTTSAAATKQLGRRLARRLRGGEVIELVSDLGGGKTTFVHGLASGIDSQDKVASPTFTISRLYRGKKLTLYHFDFYRLDDPGLMVHELHDVIGQSDVVVVVEWGDIARHVLPTDRLTVRFTRTGDEGRQLELSAPASLAYLLKDLS